MGSALSGADAAAFDQAAWCSEAVSNAKVDRKDVQATFRYVQFHHPFFGCAKPVNQLPQWTGQETVEQLAKLADAVTVICCEQVGNEGGVNSDDADALRTLNATAVANCAYVALHHPRETVRQTALQTIQRWRSAKLPPHPTANK